MNFSNPMQTDANAHRTTGAGFFPSSGFSRARFFILVLLSAFQLFRLSAFSANVRTYFINTFTGDRDTNYVVATKISSNILSSGGVIAQGIPTRLVMTNGASTNFFASGFYSLVNSSLGKGVVINVSDNGSQLYDYTNLLYSGFNTYATVYGSNLPPTYDNVTNALGFLPLTPTQTTNAILQASNSITANLTNAINGTSNSITANMTNYVSGIAATLQAEIDAIDTGGGTNGGSATNVFFLDSSTINFSTTGGSNVAKLNAQVTNQWLADIRSASNSITANLTNAINGTSNQIVSLIPTNDIYVTPPQVPATIWSDWNTPITLITNGNSVQDSNHLAEATIGNIGSKMALYYTSYDGGYTGRIWAAYGDLLNGFVKHGIVLAPTAGTWDSGLIGGATHYRENGTNYLYYFGGTNFGAFEAEPLHIGVAYSTDGTNYTKYASNPILTTNDVGGTCITLYTFFPKKVGTTNYYGYFNAKHSSGDATEKIHMARATNPLGPWTYYGYIYHHTNSTVTSDFTVADLPGGGYIAAYWKGGGVGDPATATAYSDDLIHWTARGTLINGFAFGTRLFYENGIALSYCQVTPNNTVYYTRPKLSNLGSISASQISSPLIIGGGTFITNVAANSARELVSTVGAGTTAFGAAFDDSNYYWWSFAGSGSAPTNTYDWGYNISRDTFFTAGTLEMNASLLTNASPAIATNNATATDGMALVKRGNNLKLETISGSGTGIATNGGSGTGNTFSNATLLTTTANTNYMTINGTGTSRSAFVIDGNLSQRFRMMEAYYDANTALFGVVFPNGLTSEGAIVGQSFSGDGSSLTALNASALATGYVPRPVTNSAVKTGDLVVTNNATISGNISVAGTFNVGTTTTTNLTFTGKSNALLWVTSDSTVVTTNSISSLSFSTNSLATTITPFVWLTNSSAAANGAQQVSPALMLGGNGFATTGSTSSPVSMGFYVLPVQSTAPTMALHFLKSQTGATPTSVGNINHLGDLTVSRTITSGDNISAATGTSFLWPSSSRIKAPANGRINMTDSAQTTGAKVEAGVFMATNGFTLLDSSTFPTSSVPVGSASVTNAQWIMYKGFPHIVATNLAVGGWMESTNGLLGGFVWGPFTP